MTLKNKIYGWLRLAYKKIVHLNDTPHKIAVGFALGAFIGIFPTFGLGWLISPFLAWVFRLNYASTVLGAIIVMNPVTTPFFWGVSAALGAAVFSADSREIMEQIRKGITATSLGRISVIYITGNLIVAAVVSFASYFMVKKIVSVYRKKQEQN